MINRTILLMNVTGFREACLKHFGYLRNDFGCHVSFPQLEGVPEQLQGYVVIFQNSTTRVIVTLEVIEKLPTVHIGKISVSKHERNVYPLGLLLLVRARELNPLKDETGDLPLKKSVEELFVAYAEALKIVAIDVLRGDFSIFAELDREYSRQVALGRTAPNFVYH